MCTCEDKRIANPEELCQSCLKEYEDWLDQEADYSDEDTVSCLEERDLLMAQETMRRG